MIQKSMMYCKPPSRRIRCSQNENVGKPKEGSFLYSICVPTYNHQVTYPTRPIYKQDDYLKLLKTNNNRMGIPYVPPDLPIMVYKSKPNKIPEVELDVPDRVYMRIRILKNGTLRIKLTGSIWDLYNTYYRKAIKPPFKAVLQAYKAHGFSQNFLERMKINNEKQKQLAKRIDKVFIDIFDKDHVKRMKKEKKKEEDKKKMEAEKKKMEDDKKKMEDEDNIELNEPEEEEEEEEVVDGEMDIEPEIDDEEEVEEDFLSDAE